MSKLSWIVLPLLLAAALLALSALRGRAVPRHAINVWSSVLLLAYLLATAGLGIFWVANQQLPVFDWHYLFGYATLGLVALHLVFNFGVVWRYATRRRRRRRQRAGAAPRKVAAGVPPRPDRRPLVDDEHLPGKVGSAAAVEGRLAAGGLRGEPSRGRRPPEALHGGATGQARADRAQAAPTLDPASGARRGWLFTAAAAASAAAGFAAGLHRGRSEAPATASTGGNAHGPSTAAGGADPTGALAAVERFHAASSHSRVGVLLRVPNVAWGDPPPAVKRYPGSAIEALPAPRAAHPPGLNLAALGAALWHTSGVTERRGGLLLRASPSSGALHATELYVVARGVGGLADGLWHYDPERHALARLRDDAPADRDLGLVSGAPARGSASATAVDTRPSTHVIATAIFRRTGHKYRDRTYRYVLADLGHALENLTVAAGALGVTATPLPAFDESRVAAVLGVDEAEEGVLAVLQLQPQQPRAPLQPGGAAGPGAVGTDAAPGWHMPAPPAAAPLGITAAIHAATSLRPRPPGGSAGTGSLHRAHATALALPLDPATPRPDVLARIATRRSVRRFSATALPQASLAGVLTALSGPGPALSSAVRIDVVVHAVEGLAPGAYRYDERAHALHPRRAGLPLRDAARAAALDQDVIGAAAAVFVLSIDRHAVADDPLGAGRGYRHAFIEAGRIGERVYLEAAARRLGVCAVGAFYDDEAAALVGNAPEREWVVHFAALGLPA